METSLAVVAKISLCMIVKNEEHQLENCLKSIRPYVDEICIVDTGSTDRTVEIAKRYADRFEIYTACNDPETGKINSFSDARNYSCSLASNEWIMWIDGDDEVSGAEYLHQVTTDVDGQRDGKPTRIMFPYEYSHDSDGNVTCLHYRERLISNWDRFHWVNPVHEVVIPNSDDQGLIIQCNQVKIVHRRNGSGKVIDSDRNLRILKALYDKIGESDARQLYYLGLEYGNNNQVDEAIKFLSRYVELSGWEDEKTLACIKISEHYRNRLDWARSLEWAFKATSIKENWAECYFAVARAYYYQADATGAQRAWERCVHFIRMGLSQPATSTVLFLNPLERSYEIHIYLNYALNKIGDVEGALASTVEGLKAKDCAALHGNKKIYELEIQKREVLKNIDKMIQSGTLKESHKNIVKSVLEGNDNFATVKEVERPGLIIKSSEELDIIIYVGGAPKPWTSVTARKEGIGGSETAVIEMSELFSKMGHCVRVYGDCKDIGGTFNGVEYIHHDKYHDLTCDVLITSRRPDVVDDNFNVKSSVTYSWVHDVHHGQALTYERSLKIDKFLTLTECHRDNFLKCYPYLRPEQAVKTRNGIDLSRFKNRSVKRNPHQAIYSSSPDRGMEVAVRTWPRIRELVPDAELHIYYGFEIWEICATHDVGQMNLIKELKKLLKEHERYGVFYHGRQNQQIVADAMLESGIWYYPTWFFESSCVTAMEAQAAGLKIITSPIGALNETVGPRGTMIQGDWLDPTFQNKCVEEVVKAMLNPPSDEERSSLQRYAEENFSWSSLAEEWIKMFKIDIDSKQSVLLVDYTGDV